MFKTIKNYIKTHIDPHLNKPIQSFSKIRQQRSISTDYNNNPPKIIIGLSGGPDSVFLLYFLKNLEQEGMISLIAAHLNHGWRKESVQDEQFCQELCQKLSTPIIIDHVNNLDFNPKFNGSQEEMGRKMRLYFFKKLKEKSQSDYVALAHHQQDQHETFFLRLIRGCSLSGLTAIKPVQKFYIRPLLKTSKEDILNYLHENNISYVTDKSNNSNKYLRNRIRNYVIPALKQSDKRFENKLESSLCHLSEEEKFLQKLTQQKFNKIFTQSNKNLLLGEKKLFLDLDTVIQKRLIILWLNKEKVIFSPSLAYIKEISRFISSPRGGTHKIHANWCIKKKQKFFWIETL